jgi:ParB-like partition proteins
MRHDPHFVEFISNQKTIPLVRLLKIEKIDPNPRQARCELGNIQELMDSIKNKGVLEPILVRPRGDRYEIIAGERRFVASKNIDLFEIPAIIMDVTDNEAMEISLIENLQRKDLDVFEEADGLKTLIEIYNYSHADISEKLEKPARPSPKSSMSVASQPRSASFAAKVESTRTGAS